VKILITGGAGFIGSTIADAYIEAGHEVAIVDNLARRNADVELEADSRTSPTR